ncbi:MAG: ClpP family protease [Acutalibacteraceae bacterium]|jgi:ATP-dependent protease ClpP protease subunit
MASNDNNNNSNNNNNNNEQNMNQIQELGSVESDNGKHKIFCLTIIGEIEGHNVLPEQTKTTKYEHVIPQLVSIEENDDIKGLLIILNTVGGDVEAGLAIAELISGMKKPSVSFVLGGGHSIGVPLAVSAKKSFIAPSATMTIHPVRSNGLMIGVPRMMNHFARMQARITDFVVSHSKITAEKFTELMMNTQEMVTDVGSVLNGERAVAEGLIDEIGTLSTVIQSLYDMIDQQMAEAGNK